RLHAVVHPRADYRIAGHFHFVLEVHPDVVLMRAPVDLARRVRRPRSHRELGEEIGDAFAERVAQERVVLARGHGLLLGVHRLVHDEANERFETMRGEALLLPAWAQKGFPTHRFESLVGLVVHEAVHTQQKSMPPGQHDTLLRHALGEGIADFLSELAVGPWAANTPRQIYGRAYEHDVWVDFQDEMEMASDSIIRTWMYNGMVPPDKNHGAVDIGYWVGYRIAAAYYARAADKRAAVRELLELRDPVAVLRESGYAP